MNLEESTTYQYLLGKGMEKGIVAMRKVVLRHGTAQFGVPSKRELTLLQNVGDIERLEGLDEKLPKVHGWKELLEGAGDPSS